MNAPAHIIISFFAKTAEGTSCRSYSTPIARFPSNKIWFKKTTTFKRFHEHRHFLEITIKFTSFFTCYIRTWDTTEYRRTVRFFCFFNSKGFTKASYALNRVLLVKFRTASTRRKPNWINSVELYWINKCFKIFIVSIYQLFGVRSSPRLSSQVLGLRRGKYPHGNSRLLGRWAKVLQ